MVYRSISACGVRTISPVAVLGAHSRLGRLISPVLNQTDAPNIRWQSRRPAPETFACNILGDPEPLIRFISGAHSVLNLAGVTPFSEDGHFRDNTTLALAALEAAALAGVRHVFLVSSAAVYGRAGGVQHEDTPLAPVSDYGRAKADMETAAQSWLNSAGPGAPGVTILRVGNVPGADQLISGAHNHSGIAASVTLDQFANGLGPARSYIGPVTLARVFACLFGHVTARTPLPFMLNVASTAPVLMSDLLDAAAIKWQYSPAPDGAIASVTLDTAALTDLCPAGTCDSAASDMIDQLTLVRETRQ